MSRIEKIGRPQAPQTRTNRPDLPDEPSRALVPVSGSDRETSRASAAAKSLTRAELRPAAGFLTQFIDQVGNWPRDPLRRVRRANEATSAYGKADTLPETRHAANAGKKAVSTL
ncbi:MAG: hypothetical protein GC184_02245 [Rhizobiales bacterium]|nr:hypothetical protein [Hyphomicrobiales bacterium]